MQSIILTILIFTALLFSSVFCKCDDSSGENRDHLQCLKDQVIQAGGEINKIDVHEYSPGNNGMVA